MPRKDISWLTKKPIAHRGLHDNNHLVPENSLLAFERAIERQYCIELDIHLLSDGNIAVFHDADLSRMCSVNVRISNLTKDELSRYTLSGTSGKIPLIEEVFNLVAGKVPLLIELKESSHIGRFGPALLNKLETYNGLFALQSFNPFYIAWFARHAPEIPRGQLASNFSGEKMSWFSKVVLKNFLLNFMSQPDFIGYRSNDLPNTRVDRQRKKHRYVLAWTITSQSEFDRIRQIADNIIFEGFQPTI